MGQPVPVSDLPANLVPPDDLPDSGAPQNAGTGVSAPPTQPSGAPRLNDTEQGIVDQTMGKKKDSNFKLGPVASSIVRPMVKGATAIPAMVSDAATGAVNTVGDLMEDRKPGTSPNDVPMPSKTFEDFLDTYTTKPKGVANNLAEGVSSMMFGGVEGDAMKAESAVEKGIKGASETASKETVKQASYREARANNLRVAPEEQEGGSSFMKEAQALGGKGKVNKEISEHNVQQFDELARQSLGLPENHPLDELAMENVRNEAGRAYERLSKVGNPVKTDDQMIKDILNVGFDVEKLESEAPGFNKESIMKELDRIRGSLLQDKFSPGSMIKMIRSLRKDARMNMKSTDDPDKWATGVFQRQGADLLESRLERFAGQEMKDPSLVQDMQNARRVIARSYAVEDALNTQTGHVDAHVLARLSDDLPLDGPLLTIANFAKAFPKSSQNIDKLGTGKGITMNELAVAAAAFAYHHPVVAGVAAARSVGRSVASSGLSQPQSLVKGAKDGSILSPEAKIAAGATGAENANEQQ